MERCSTEDRQDETFVDHCIDEAVLVRLDELGLSEDIASIEFAERTKGMKLFKDEHLSQELQVR
jgi:hypothetical protein